MFTLHAIQTKTKITLLKDEFFKLIEKFNKIEPVKIIDEDPDYLTEDEIKIRTEALMELEKGETVSADEYFKKRFPKENVNV